MNADSRREPPSASEARLYVSDPAGWEVHIKRGWDKEYCFFQNPDEDYFHLLMAGEIYLERDTEKVCLTCALRHGFVTAERLTWQKGGKSPPDAGSPDT